MLREAAALRHEATERQAKAAAITVPLAALRVALLPLLPQLHSREHGVADQLAEVEGCNPRRHAATLVCYGRPHPHVLRMGAVCHVSKVPTP